MDIRKADSKGRITGFLPGQHYRIQDSDGVFSIEKLPDLVDPVARPVPEEAIQYLLSFGLDPKQIARDGADQSGYSEFQREGDKYVYLLGRRQSTRKPWPEGFDWKEFIRLATVLK